MKKVKVYAKCILCEKPISNVEDFNNPEPITSVGWCCLECCLLVRKFRLMPYHPCAEDIMREMGRTKTISFEQYLKLEDLQNKIDDSKVRKEYEEILEFLRPIFQEKYGIFKKKQYRTVDEFMRKRKVYERKKISDLK